MSESLDKPSKFSWPPGKPAPSDAKSAKSQVAPASRVTNWLHQIEQDWLGLLYRPVLAELASEAWQPDTDTMYCPRCGKSVSAFELLPIEDDGEDPENRPEGSRRDCSSCFRRRLPWEQFIRLGSYDDALREAVLETKFRGGRTTGLVLGRLLGTEIAARAKYESIPLSKIVIVPVPMHPWRRISRGIDHTLTLARGIRSALPGSKLRRMLKRRGLRPTQVEIAPSSRRANVSRTIVPTWTAAAKPGQLLVVVDDVRTTGATLGEACRSLRSVIKSKLEENSKFVRIWAASVAVSESDKAGREVVQSGKAITD